MEPRSGTRRKIQPRCIVNSNTSRQYGIDAYVDYVLHEVESGVETLRLRTFRHIILIAT